LGGGGREEGALPKLSSRGRDLRLWIIDGVGNELKLKREQVEPNRVSFVCFGNTSSTRCVKWPSGGGGGVAVNKLTQKQVGREPSCAGLFRSDTISTRYAQDRGGC
jgi:hypothetical protein